MNWKFWKKSPSGIVENLSTSIRGKHCTPEQIKSVKVCFKNGMTAKEAHLFSGVSYCTCAKYYRIWRDK